MYPQQATVQTNPSVPKRAELVINALDSTNQSLSDGVHRIETALTRLGYNFPPQDAKAEGPKAVPLGAFGTIEEKLQHSASWVARLHDLATIFEGFV